MEPWKNSIWNLTSANLTVCIAQPRKDSCLVLVSSIIFFCALDSRASSKHAWSGNRCSTAVCLQLKWITQPKCFQVAVREGMQWEGLWNPANIFGDPNIKWLCTVVLYVTIHYFIKRNSDRRFWLPPLPVTVIITLISFNSFLDQDPVSVGTCMEWLTPPSYTHCSVAVGA